METIFSVPLKCFDGDDTSELSSEQSKLGSVKIGSTSLGSSVGDSISEFSLTFEESFLESSKRDMEEELNFWSMVWWKDSHESGSSTLSFRSTLIFSQFHSVTLIGKKDAMVVIIFCLANAISLACWNSLFCLFCCSDRGKPEHVDLVATSALDSQLTVENATFCNTSTSYLNVTQQKSTLDTTITKISSNYWEISLCLGWTRREYLGINRIPTAIYNSGY